MTEAVSEPVPRTDAAQAPAGSLPRAVPGVPWVAGIFVGIFFALWCGLNYGVLACIQCWPFSRIRQPWGSTVAVLGVVAWEDVDR